VTDDEEVDFPIPASVVSDIERIDKATDYIIELCERADFVFAYEELEPVLDALGDARTGLLYLAKKLHEATERNEGGNGRSKGSTFLDPNDE
jgi:hypothetical protein